MARFQMSKFLKFLIFWRLAIGFWQLIWILIAKG